MPYLEANVKLKEAIQKHYNENKDHRPQTSKVLSRELWTGQQHGSPNDPLHARHMRSHCKCIPRGKSPLYDECYLC